ncbi:hypothetical protein [Olleya sp. HaHaR_3_96]|uniref:hypothetical protein n=1 Tax=Olleya sp. HaHaR_3_96 TaxID=2745560 RepID=UPI001C4E4069|nr:hypothetical protein [Olleya sp. HaHaR_3_96]QXP59323.1 hypothetical protein H0I26_15565 [Olleya sp. HaHaR_3_96]
MPELLFDGIQATVYAKADIGLTIKKGYFEGKNLEIPIADFTPETPYTLARAIDIIEKN